MQILGQVCACLFVCLSVCLFCLCVLNFQNPPSSSSSQTFIQQDPLQTSNILQLLLTEYDKSDILAPLFHPNLCPQQFVEMYGSSIAMATKEGPTVAFSVLTKVIVGVVEWAWSRIIVVIF